MHKSTHSHRQSCCKSLAALLAVFFLCVAPAQGQVVINSGTTRNPRTTMPLRNFNNTNPTANNDTASNPFDHDSTATEGLVYAKETPDSVLRQKVFFFTFSPHSVKIDEIWNPTLDPTGVQYSDPLDAMDGNFYLGKGVIGHPHKGLYHALPDGIQYALNKDENEAYLKHPSNLRFYQTLTPYTLLSYNSSLNKDYLLHLAHTQNIIPGWNVAFDYRLICPDGVFANSGAKNHYLDFTTNYFSRDSRLQAQLGFIWQDFELGENGGLTDDTYFTEARMTNSAGLPMRYSSATAHHLRHNLFGRVSYNLVRQVEQVRYRDSLATRLDSSRADSVVTVLDTIEVADTLRVGSPRVLNAGVVGLEMSYYRRKRAAFLPALADSTLWSEATATLFWTNDAYPDHRWHNPLKVTLGITPRRLGAILRTDTASVHDTLVAFAALNPFAQAVIALGPSTLTARAELDYTLSSLDSKLASFNSQLSTLYRLPFDSTAHSGLELTAVLQRHHPDLRILYANAYTLPEVEVQSFGLRLFHDADHGLLRTVDLSLRASRFDHFSWYADSLLTIHTGTDPFWLAQAALTLRLAAGWFHVDMQQLVQYSTDEVQMAVPLWASKNSVYADFTLFSRALRMQVGADLRYHTLFDADAYDPLTGLFYSHDQQLGDYLWGDVFINLQVKRASIYLKAGHLNALWESRPGYMLLPHYPGQRFGLFWGLTWHFFD